MGAGEGGVDVSGRSCLSLMASDQEYHLLLLLHALLLFCNTVLLGIPVSVPSHTVTQACISSNQAITTGE